MNIRKAITISTGITLLTFSAAMLAQEGQQQAPAKSKGGKASPHATVSLALSGKKIAVTYGRPSKKGRQIFGGLVPSGQVWRTGADEATVLETEGDIMLGSLHVPKGSYSVFTIPGDKEWTLILNKEVNQWGAFKYNQAADFGRTTMKVQKASAPVEQFTITLHKRGNTEADLRMAWDDVVATATIMMH
jgi:hypothetical protein